MLRLRYFGPFAALRDGEPVAFPTRPCARLLAILGLDPAKPHLRESLARLVWPEAEWGRETANLRTALSMLRAVVGREVVIADRETVRLDPGVVESDWDEARRLLRRADVDPEPERRELALRELTRFGDEAVLEGWEADWIRPLRVERVRSSAKGCIELAQIRLASGDFNEARELARRAIQLQPRSELAISVAMRAVVGAGEPAQAIHLFEQYRKRAGSVSPDLASFAAEISRVVPPVFAATPAPSEADGAFLELFESGLEDDPQGTVQFLLQKRRFWWRHRDLRRGQEFLSRALAADLPTELRLQGLVTLAGLYYRTSAYPETLQTLGEARALCPGTGTPVDLWIDGGRCLVLFDTRRWAECRTEIGSLLHRIPPEDPYRIEIEMLLGGVEMHELHLGEARAQYEGAMARANGAHPQTAYVAAVGSANLACLATIEGDWKELEREASDAREALTMRMDPHYAAGPIAQHALARAAQGDVSALPDLLRAPLEPVRGGARRFAQVVFDVVAEGLAHHGYGRAAREVLRANTDLRASIGHPRSPAEEMCAGRAERRSEENLGPSVPRFEGGSPDDHAALASWIANLSPEAP